MQKKWGLNIQWDVRFSSEGEQDLWSAQPGKFPRQFPPYPFLSLFLLFTARRTLVFVLLLLLFWAFPFLLETGSCCATWDDLERSPCLSLCVLGGWVVLSGPSQWWVLQGSVFHQSNTAGSCDVNRTENIIIHISHSQREHWDSFGVKQPFHRGPYQISYIEDIYIMIYNNIRITTRK